MFESDFILKISEIHTIGKVACKNHWYDVCIQWYEIAKQLLPSIKDKALQNDFIQGLH